MLNSIRRRYGRILGLFRVLKAGAAHTIGRLDRFSDARAPKNGRLVFVCAGNICRSPFAAAVATSLGCDAISMGLNADDGKPVWNVLAKRAAIRGVDLAPHRAGRFRTEKLRPGDRVIAFEPAQARELARLAGAEVSVSLLGFWTKPRRYHIEDPYGMGEPYVDHCLTLIAQAVAQMCGSMSRGR